MNRKVYCGCDSDFGSHYKIQAGKGYDDINVFKGQPYQRGYGIGSFLKRIGIPIFKSLLRTGVDIGGDILDNKGIKETLRNRGKEGIRTTARTALNEIGNMIEQTGSGLRKRKRKQNHSIRKTKKAKTSKRKSTKSTTRRKRKVKRTKRQRKDIFN